MQAILGEKKERPEKVGKQCFSAARDSGATFAGKCTGGASLTGILWPEQVHFRFQRFTFFFQRFTIVPYSVPRKFFSSLFDEDFMKVLPTRGDDIFCQVPRKVAVKREYGAKP